MQYGDHNICRALSLALRTQRQRSCCLHVAQQEWSLVNHHRMQCAKCCDWAPGERSAESPRARNLHLFQSWQTVIPSKRSSFENDPGGSQSPELAHLGFVSVCSTGGATGRNGMRSELCSVLWESLHRFVSCAFALSPRERRWDLNLGTLKGVPKEDRRMYKRGKKRRHANEWVDSILKLSWEIFLGWKTTVTTFTLNFSCLPPFLETYF